MTTWGQICSASVYKDLSVADKFVNTYQSKQPNIINSKYNYMMQTTLYKHHMETPIKLSCSISSWIIFVTLLIWYVLTIKYCSQHIVNNNYLNQPYSKYNSTRWHFALGAYVAIAMKPIHRLQICPIVHTRGHLLPFSKVTSGCVQ